MQSITARHSDAHIVHVHLIGIIPYSMPKSSLTVANVKHGAKMDPVYINCTLPDYLRIPVVYLKRFVDYFLILIACKFYCSLFTNVYILIDYIGGIPRSVQPGGGPGYISKQS